MSVVFENVGGAHSVDTHLGFVTVTHRGPAASSTTIMNTLSAYKKRDHCESQIKWCFHIASL
jgi:hypothetical protein